MSTTEATISTPAKEPTFHDLAYQAACDAKLNSFAEAYKHNPTHVETIAGTFLKDFPANNARLTKLCDNRLVNQMDFMMEEPGRSAQLAVLFCTFPTTKGTDAVFAGSLGDSMDVLCPVTICMRDVKGNAITIASIKSIPTRLKLTISTTDPLAEEAPDPVPDAEANPGEEEGALRVAPPPVPDRLHLEITDPTDAPCIIMIPKIFPLSGRHSIPKGEPVDVATVASLKDNTEAPTMEEFHLLYESMRYGIVHLQNYSIQETPDTLFSFEHIDDGELFTKPDANTAVKRFTFAVNFLYPTDPTYRTVTNNVLASKEKAMVEYGSNLAPRFTTPTKAPTAHPATTTPSVTQPLAEDR